MIRRLSNFKSTATINQQKSLLDYSYFDHEMYGYENEGCVALNGNADETEEHDDEHADTPYDNDVDDAGIETHRQNLNEKDFGMLALDSDSSDSDEGSPVPQKKGLRRFFCMPKKSKTTLKSTSSLMSSGANSIRRSLRKPKRKDPSLLDFDE